MKLFNTIKSQIPNAITLCNLTCGVAATYFACNYQLGNAAWFILLGIVFDFFDGLSARLLHVASPIGKELDSLADVVTSGVAPGMILYALLDCCVSQWVVYIAFLTPALAAYRLAKFNLDTRQSHDFRGLPAPANALIWVGVALLYEYSDEVFSLALIWNPAVKIALAVLSIFSAILMVTDLPMFSLKFNFKDMSWHTNKLPYTFLLGSLILIVTLRFACLPVIVLWYILLSLIACRKEPRNE